MAKEDSWRTVNVNLGVLSACVLGVFTVVSSFVGVQYWVDDRIERAITPVEERVDRVVQECRQSCYQRWHGDGDNMAYELAACEVKP